MKKNVSGHLSPVSPTETILQPEHSYKGMTPREDVNTCFNSVVCTHLPKTSHSLYRHLPRVEKQILINVTVKTQK